jgi:hypothetical protein
MSGDTAQRMYEIFAAQLRIDDGIGNDADRKLLESSKHLLVGDYSTTNRNRNLSERQKIARMSNQQFSEYAHRELKLIERGINVLRSNSRRNTPQGGGVVNLREVDTDKLYADFVNSLKDLD